MTVREPHGGRSAAQRRRTGARRVLALGCVVGAFSAACTANIGDGVVTTPTFAPTTSPLDLQDDAPPPTEVQPTEPIVIHATGEALLDPEFLPVVTEVGWGVVLSSVSPVFRADDVSIVSLACPAGEVGEPALLFNSRQCDAQAIDALAGAGVDVVTLAHPHVLDQGPEAVAETIRLIEGAGMIAVGAGTDATSARETKLLVRKGFSIAVIAASLVPTPVPAASASEPTIHHILDPVDFAQRLESAIQTADYVVVSLHGGTADDQAPDEQLSLTAQAASEAGADFVFTSGAHRLYRLALIDERPVAFGLGDFVFPRSSEAAADTAVAEVVLRPGVAPEACLLGVTVQEDGSPQLDRPDQISCIEP